jgi:hypothetical protein
MVHQLTAEMKKSLRNIVRGKEVSKKLGTLKGLAARGLYDLSGLITHEGWKQALVMLPLEEQCHLLGVAHEKLPSLGRSDHPELEVWRYFSSRGFRGAYCEGGPVLLLIRAAALDLLARINTFQSRQDACQRFTEAQLTIHKENADLILNAIRSADVAQIVRHFKEIYTSPMTQECYPGLTAETMASLFVALGAERLAQITAVIMEDSSYRAGWPDLTMVNGSEMLWVEVKTTDRLHMSQISTIHRMKPLLPGDIRVVQLV